MDDVFIYPEGMKDNPEWKLSYLDNCIDKLFKERENLKKDNFFTKEKEDKSKLYDGKILIIIIVF